MASFEFDLGMNGSQEVDRGICCWNAFGNSYWCVAVRSAVSELGLEIAFGEFESPSFNDPGQVGTFKGPL